MSKAIFILNDFLLELQQELEIVKSLDRVQTLLEVSKISDVVTTVRNKLIGEIPFDILNNISDYEILEFLLGVVKGNKRYIEVIIG